VIRISSGNEDETEEKVIHSYGNRNGDNPEKHTAEITEEDRKFIQDRFLEEKEDGPIGIYEPKDIDFVDINNTDKGEYSAKIHIEKESEDEEESEDEDHLLLSSEGFVGFLKLPSGKKIEIKPKKSAEELDDHYLSMWRYVNFGSGWEYPDETDLGKGEEFLNSMGEILNSEINQIIKKGLNKDYVKVRDETRYLKGKLLAKEQMRSHTDETFNVEYEEISRDNPLNQLLLFATDRLRKMTVGETSNNLDRHYGYLRDEAELKSEAEIRSKLDEIDVDSTNAYYETAVEVSKKVVRNTYYSADEGESSAYSFLIDMNYLFEEFVRKLLDGIYDSAEKPPEKNLFDESEGDYEQIIKPDLVLNEGFVGDVKYKTYGNIKPDDYYQVITYSTLPDYEDHAFIVFLGGDGGSNTGEAKISYDQSNDRDNRVLHMIGLFDLLEDRTGEVDFVEQCKKKLREYLSKKETDELPSPN
jgi:5-methylcytosine-specific restriction enzyme subunit McrC